MENKCVLHIEKIHTFSALYAQQRHNNREIPLANVDKNKTVENKVLFSYGGMSYTDAFKEIIKAQELTTGKKVFQRSNSVIALDILTSYSKDADINVDQWAKENLQWMKDTFGEKNIIACTLHMDETTPHIHTEIVPLVNGKLCAKELTGGRKAMADLQTSYGKAMERCGLERGNKKSRSKKKDLTKFYSSVNKAVTAKLPPQMRGEEDEDYLRRMEDYCRTIKLANENLLLQLDEAKAITNSKVAEEFSKYTTAVSLQEDLTEKYDNNMDSVNDRLTLYRRIENMMPKKDLDTLLKNIVDRYHKNETPLTNWAKFGNYAIEKKKKKDEFNFEKQQQDLFSSFASDEPKDDFELYKQQSIDEDEDF